MLLASAHNQGIAQSPRFPSPGIAGSPDKANMWEDFVRDVCTNLYPGQKGGWESLSKGRTKGKKVEREVSESREVRERRKGRRVEKGVTGVEK